MEVEPGVGRTHSVLEARHARDEQAKFPLPSLQTVHGSLSCSTASCQGCECSVERLDALQKGRVGRSTHVASVDVDAFILIRSECV